MFMVCTAHRVIEEIPSPIRVEVIRILAAQTVLDLNSVSGTLFRRFLLVDIAHWPEPSRGRAMRPTLSADYLIRPLKHREMITVLGTNCARHTKSLMPVQ
jgi:hypothetical protein